MALRYALRCPMHRQPLWLACPAVSLSRMTPRGVHAGASRNNSSSTAAAAAVLEVARPEQQLEVEHCRDVAQYQVGASSVVGEVISASSNYYSVEVADTSSGAAPSPSSAPSTAGAGALPSSAAAARRRLLCTPRALLRKMAQRVMVGDHVVLSDVDWVGSRGVVDDVLPRRSCLDNPPVANVDHVLLALSLDSPAFDETQATRFLVAAESCGFSFTLLLNKADLVPPEALQRRLAQLARWGYPAPLVVSCTTGMGVAAVGEVLRGRTSVVTGPSGAGKSSLINALRLGRHRRDDAGGRKSATGFGGDDGGGGSGPQAAQAPQAAAAAATATATSPSASTPELSVQMPGTASTSSTSASTTSTTTTSYSNDDQSSSSGGHVHSSDCGTSTSSGDTLPPLQASPSTLHLPASSAAAVAAAGTEAFSFIRVGDLTRRGQGTHTTTSVTLIRLPAGGLLADTPGFGLPGLDHLKPLELAACFPEFFAPLPPPTPTPTAAEEDGGDVDAAATMAAAAAAAAEAAEAAAVAKAAEAAATAEWQREAGGTKGQEDAGGTGCRYANCLHRGDAGCAVTARAPERHGMYLRLLTEIQEREEHDVKAIQMEKRQREGATRVKVGKGGVARVEAKLNTSKHRATARGAGKLDMLERPTGGRGMHLEKERPGQGGGRQRGPE